MASYYMATHKDPAVKVFAIISGSFGIPKNAYMDSIEHFKKIKNVKIVDVYGSEDLQPILDIIKKRKVLGMKLHKNQYQQVRIEGADHFYRGKQDGLVKALNKRLEKLAAH